MKSDRMFRLRVAALASAAVIVAVTLLSGCNTNGCLDNRSSLPKAGFYSATDGKAIDVDSLEVGGVGAPNDSLLLAPGRRATFVYLPLRQTRQSTSFYIAYKWKDLDRVEDYDTLTIDYEATPYFASEECGALQHYKIKKIVYTRHLLDSVAIIPADSVIDNLPVENMKLYFITDPEVEGEEAEQ